MLEKHKCFISFKTEDQLYKKYIQKNIDIEMIDKSLNEPINSTDKEYVMQEIRNQNLRDSSITIFLIGKYSSENNYDNQYYIKKELQAWLYKSYNHGRNGILGIVLPDMYEKIYKGSYKCNKCGNNHNYVKIDDDTVIKEFSENYYIKKNHTSCAWSENERYCMLTKWDEFIKNPNIFINLTWDKRKEDIVKNITVYPK